MKKLTIIAAMLAASVMTGCKFVEVENNGKAVATVTNASGEETVVKDAAGNPIILARGWKVKYNQHWNWQSFDSMNAETGDGAKLQINGYAGGSDATNLTGLVSASFSGGAQLALAIADAYTTIAGGGAQAQTATDVAAKVLNYFKASGGDESKASVTTDTTANTLTVSDGTTCTTCTADGNCTSGSCTK